ncbi:hypothetical protein MK280_13645 [Myxococcota bacterium]|nr:hypothetical protein [Myxococcota bacterium]
MVLVAILLRIAWIPEVQGAMQSVAEPGRLSSILAAHPALFVSACCPLRPRRPTSQSAPSNDPVLKRSEVPAQKEAGLIRDSLQVDGSDQFLGS